jgi:hypothetical protein
VAIGVGKLKEGISIVVYGRNDSHGYNLHRRAALSFNAIAHVLSDNDEILFCDCNTADDLPTFPEAIADTLTERARALLRIIRVRSRDYSRLAPNCRLPVCEPFCRNVALRRSNPANQWILSTNTDMLFLPLVGKSLADVIAGLESYLYIAPRFELPEICWESLNRSDPAQAIDCIRRWGASLRLNHVIRGKQPIVFDAPGDFQLLPRDLAFKLDGFNESIVNGWHVDGNLCARAALATGGNRSLEHRVRGYHCDHNRISTFTHTSAANLTGNIKSLIDKVSSATIPNQRTTWGAPYEVFEEIRLGGTLPRITRIEALIPFTESTSSELMAAETHNQGVRPSINLVIPHLVNHLITRRAPLRLGYLGFSNETLAALRAWANQAKVELEIFTDPPMLPYIKTNVASISLWEQIKNIDVVIADADPGMDEHIPSAGEDPAKRKDVIGEKARMLAISVKLLARQCSSLLNVGPRVLALNSQNSWLEKLLSKHFNLTLAPYASRVRPATVRQRGSKLWLRRLSILKKN